MKCLRLFCMCCVISVICFCLSITCSAEEFEDSSASDQVVEEDPAEEQLPADEFLSDDSLLEDETENNVGSSEASLSSLYDEENPLPVVIVSEDYEGYSVESYSDSVPDIVIGDEPPAEPLFYGSAWVTGIDSNLGRITIYWPISYQSGYFGIDSNGYLFNVSSSSLSGYLSGVYNNSVSASAFSYPRYREYSGSSYSYVDLHLIPENSNMEIATSNTPKYGPEDFVPYILVFMLGVVIVCFMKRS